MKADKILGALSKPDYQNIEITEAVIEQYDADKAKVDIEYNEKEGIAYLDTDIPHCKTGKVFNFNFDVLLPDMWIENSVHDKYLNRDRNYEQFVRDQVSLAMDKLVKTIDTTFDPDNFNPSQEDIESDTVYIEDEDSFFWDKVDHKFVRYYLFIDEEHEVIDARTDEDLFFQVTYTNDPEGDKWDLETLKKEQPFFHKVLTETNKLDDFLEKSNKFYDQNNSN